MRLHILLAFSVCLLTVQFGMAQDKRWSCARADGHAPIGVMGDHVHHKGE